MSNFFGGGASADARKAREIQRVQNDRQLAAARRSTDTLRVSRRNPARASAVRQRLAQRSSGNRRLMADSVVDKKKLADLAWSQRAPWDAMTEDAYRYAIPHRAPLDQGRPRNPANYIYDMTAPNSAMHFGSKLKESLFPSGEPPFFLQSGALARKLPAGDRKILDRRLEAVGEFMFPFMHAGNWDAATTEMCTDLGIGTGAIIPLKGDNERPVHFYAIPAIELAVRTDTFGRDVYVTWQRQVEMGAVRAGFPNGRFGGQFERDSIDRPYDECRLYQDFRRLADGMWEFCAYVEKNPEPIVSARYRTQPVAVTRYHRLAGDAYGRGVILLAMPAIKTLNKAQELTLRAASINLLGIWAYRAGGTFNPDTVKVGPAQFWPMLSTGGALGPDVQRLDPSGANPNIANLVLDNLQSQVRSALMDERLPETRGTPKSASEIAAMLRQGAENQVSVHGRLWRECLPVIVPRTAEILEEFGYLDGLMNFNELLVSIGVRSPMATSLKAGRMQALASYVEFVTALVGPEQVWAYADRDEIIEALADVLMISAPHGARRGRQATGDAGDRRAARRDRGR